IFAKTWERFPSQEPLATDEFWASAISNVKGSYGDFIFMAEVYWGLERRLQSLGFDYTYDKSLYDLLLARQPGAVQRWVLDSSKGGLATGAHFLENHDERRIAASMSLAEHQAAALVILGLPGLRFLHEGQLDGARLKVPVQLTHRPAEPVDTKIQK